MQWLVLDRVLALPSCCTSHLFWDVTTLLNSHEEPDADPQNTDRANHFGAWLWILLQFLGKPFCLNALKCVVLCENYKSHESRFIIS